MRVRLIPADGSAEVELTRDMVLVGRGENCNVRVDHKSVSKLHAVLVITDGLVLLRDLGSTNGTRVNGTRVRRAALLPNDQVAFANFRFTLAFGSAFLKPDERAAGDDVRYPEANEQPLEEGDATLTESPGVRKNRVPDRIDE